jgi:hypothetical protein
MADFYTRGDGRIMPRTGIWINPGSGRWGMLRPKSDKAQRIQDLYEAQLKSE